MKRALIDPRTDRVCQVENPAKEFAVASPLFWVDCGDAITPRYTYVNGNFIAEVVEQEPPAKDYSELNNIPKLIKATVFAAARLSGKTSQQARAAFKDAWNSLP